MDASDGTRHQFHRKGKRLDLGNLEIYTDFTEEEVSQVGDAFTLSGSGGSIGYNITQSIMYDHTKTDSGIAVFFFGLPINAQYTLKVVLSDGMEMELFKDVPFEEIHQESQRLVQDSHPPG